MKTDKKILDACCGSLSYIPYPDEYILRRVVELKGREK
jgi:hypothetical protein